MGAVVYGGWLTALVVTALALYFGLRAVKLI
jgi:hypothetical protein